MVCRPILSSPGGLGVSCIIKTSGSLGHSTLLCLPSTMTYMVLETLRMIVILVGIKPPPVLRYHPYGDQDG